MASQKQPSMIRYIEWFLPEFALFEGNGLECSDDAEVVRATSESKPQVGVRIFGRIDGFPRR